MPTISAAVAEKIRAEVSAAVRDPQGRRALTFFRTKLRYTKGEFAGQFFTLLPWQEELIARLFGVKRPDGFRRYRTAYVEIPRKNGKTELGAGIALKLLCADSEPGAEVYSAAADKEQASLVFNAAKAMVEQDPELRKELQIYRSAIVHPRLGNTYKVLSAEAFTKHGINAHGIVFDEVHAQPSRELWDVLTTSTGARRQPLTIGLTTAGYDRHSLCWELHEHALRILAGEVTDPSFLPMVFSADPEDDWTDPAVWAKANPSLGVTLKPAYMEAECARAKMLPAYENTFRRLHLNQWTENETRWLRMEDWTACERELGDLDGEPCFGGLDLGAKLDLNAFALWFPKQRALLCHFWLPRENLRERMDRDRVPYDQWERAGFLTLTDGNSVDQDAIRRHINALSSRYEIQEIGFDPWNATQMSYWLQEDGAKVWELRQGFKTLSEPTKEFEKLVVSHTLAHDGNPILRWQVGNVIPRVDENGNARPDKARSRGRIDGVVAAIMAIAVSLREPPKKASVYESRGVRTF